MNDATRWLQKGIELANSERFQEAIECFEEALTEDPKYDRAWFHKGEALAAILRFEEAGECYRKATELDHEYAAAWYGQGLALVALGDFEQAIKCFDEAIRIDPHLDGVKEDREKALKDLAEVSGKTLYQEPPTSSMARNNKHRLLRRIANIVKETDWQPDMKPGMSPLERQKPVIPADERSGWPVEHTTSLQKGQGKIVVLMYMVCKLPLRFGDNLLWCPYCGILAHRNHLLEWLHVKNSCPSCGHQLDEEDMANSA